MRRWALAALVGILGVNGCGRGLDTRGSGSSSGPQIAFTPKSGPAGTLMTITGVDLSGAQAVTVGGVPALLISATSAAAVAYVMPGASQGPVTVAMSSGFTFSSSDAFTPGASQAPAIQVGGKFVATSASATAQQGAAVAISADGNTALIGGNNDNASQGATWVFVRSGGTWAQQAKLVASSAAAAQGTAVALSADGNTAMIGGPFETGGGAVWVFTRSGTQWTQQTKIQVSDSVGGNPQLGRSVRLSADGNTALIGGSNDATSKGAAWVYVRAPDGSWTEQQKLVGASASASASMGANVALSADGNTAVLGGFGDTPSGAVWVFVRSGSSWTQQGSKLTGTGATSNAQFGSAVSISADGNTLIAGAPADNTSKGGFWSFVRAGTSWMAEGSGKFVASSVSTSPQEGIWVSLSADGNTALIGGNGETPAGAMWSFTHGGGTWTAQAKLAGSPASSSAQGTALELSADGSTALIGGFNDNASAGAFWFFVH